MRLVLGTLFLALATLLQVTLVYRVTLLQGPANLVLLVMFTWSLQDFDFPDWRWGVIAGLMLSLYSALPLWVLLFSYTLAAATAQFLQQRVWQVRLLTLFASVAIGSLLIDGISLVYLWLSANPINLLDAFNLVLLPSLVLNMILVFPVFALINEVSKLLIPSEFSP